MHQDFTPVTLNNSKHVAKPTIGPKKITAKNHTDMRAIKIENETEQFSNPTVPNALAQEISSARTTKKLTQKEIAQKLNIPQTTYNKIESGKAIYDPSTKKIIGQIEKVLGVKMTKR